MRRTHLWPFIVVVVTMVPQLADAQAVRGARVHDGLYLRLATGFGPFRDSVRDLEDGVDVKVDVSGVATAGEIALGGTVAPGTVVGVGIYHASVLASDVSTNDQGEALPIEVDPTDANLTLVAPFVDWYRDPRRGLHFQWALGIAALGGLSYDVGRFEDSNDPAVGIGLMFGVGYDWFVSNQWSLGVLGRLMGAVAFEEDTGGGRWAHLIGTFPSILFTATFH